MKQQIPVTTKLRRSPQSNTSEKCATIEIVETKDPSRTPLHITCHCTTHQSKQSHQNQTIQILLEDLDRTVK